LNRLSSAPFQPLTFSVIKTRMQSLEAKKQYRNALHCAYRIATEEGVLQFWKGTVPRLGRLVVSSVLGSRGEGQSGGPRRRNLVDVASSRHPYPLRTQR
jgi:hypothetical protein